MFTIGETVGLAESIIHFHRVYSTQECSETLEQECNVVNVPQCSDVFETECSTVNEQSCSTTFEQECTTTNQQECETFEEEVIFDVVMRIFQRSRESTGCEI